jgi:hypothetical protein
VEYESKKEQIRDRIQEVLRKIDSRKVTEEQLAEKLVTKKAHARELDSRCKKLIESIKLIKLEI